MTRILNWEEEERPREKFLAKGAGSLSNTELLAILLRSGNREENALELARRIFFRAGNRLKSLQKFSYQELHQFKGIGTGKALSILAAFELARRTALEQMPEQAAIYSSGHAADTIAPLLKDLLYEECWILYLNRSNRLTGKERLSSGGTAATVVDIKLILKNALLRLASSIILVHNHPSGNPQPGEQDRIQTRRLKEAAAGCDIVLLDHLIIAGDGYFSFSDEGLL